MEQVEQKFRVTAQEQGRRLDVLLAARYPRFTRASWHRRIRDGQVTIGSRPARAGRRMRAGEEVVFRYRAKPEPAVDEDYLVVYEDDDVLVIDKPGNLPVHPSGNYRQNTLLGLLRRDRGEDFVAHFAHRLDRETSGLIVLGRHPAAARALALAFRRNEVRKEYLALVEGRPPRYLDARGFLGRATGSRIFRKRHFQTKRPPESVERFSSCRTEFRALWTREMPDGTGPVTLVYARLHTGRLHQIRASLCSLGYPMVGDRIYGVDETIYLRLLADSQTPEDFERLRIARCALHCRRLVLPHPKTGRQIRLRSPLPEDMRRLIFPDERFSAAGAASAGA